jgi:hypothetical protein
MSEQNYSIINISMNYRALIWWILGLCFALLN